MDLHSMMKSKTTTLKLKTAGFASDDSLSFEYLVGSSIDYLEDFKDRVCCY